MSKQPKIKISAEAEKFDADNEIMGQQALMIQTSWAKRLLNAC